MEANENVEIAQKLNDQLHLRLRSIFLCGWHLPPINMRQQNQTSSKLLYDVSIFYDYLNHILLSIQLIHVI